MDAIVWLLDTIGRKMNKKLMIIRMVLLAFLVVALNFMEINAALCFFTICLAMVTERIFFDEITKNNVIPLNVICGNKSTLINLFTQKILCMEIPHLLIMAVISVGWSCLHHTGLVHTLWSLVAVGLFWEGWSQCIFLHFGLMFFNSKAATWFEMGIFVVENLILQLMQMLNIVVQIAVLTCAAVLLLVAFVGKQFITSREREEK